MNAKQRTLGASKAAHSRWAKEDPHPALEHVRAGWIRSFEDRVDPDRVLKPTERARRVEAEIKAHMGRLAIKSVKARRHKRKGAGK